MRLVAFDVETHKIQRGLLCPPLVCGSFADSEGADLKDKAATIESFLALLDDEDVVIAGANIAYDMLVMANTVGTLAVMQAIFSAYESGRVWDVSLSQALNDIKWGHLGMMYDGSPMRVGGKISQRYSLAMVTKIHTGREDAKLNDRWRTSYALLEDTPLAEWPDDARQYPIDDAVNTLEVATAQTQLGNQFNLPAQVYSAWAMHLGAGWGFCVDQYATAALKEEATARKIAGAGHFVRSGLLRANGTKDTAVIKSLVAGAFGASEQCHTCEGSTKMPSEKTGKPINCKACNASGLHLDGTRVPRTPTGGIGAGRDVLLESGNELLMEFADYTARDKVLSTYIPWLEKGAPLKPNALLVTGRASCGTAQTIPQSMGIRNCITARPGTALISCDYAALELATHAQSCIWLMPDVHCSLAQAINSGVKVHDLLGAQMSGLDYEAFLTKRLAGDKYCNDIRQAAKAANFGFPGGMGVVTFVLAKRKDNMRTGKYKGIRFCMLIGGEDHCGTEMVTTYKRREYPPVCLRCIECVEDLKQNWFATWGENKRYFKLIAEDVDRGYIVQHKSNRVRGGVSFTSAANGYFQGLASEGAKLALTRVAKEQWCNQDSDLFGSRSILFAHDEIIMETPLAKVNAAAMRLKVVMEESMRVYVPDVAIEAEPAAMLRWSKGAQPVFNEEGELIPWTP